VPVFPPVDALSIAVYAALGAVVFVAVRIRPVDAIVALVATAPFDWSHAIGPTTLTFDKVALVAAVLALAARRPPLAIYSHGAPRALLVAILAVLAATVLSFGVARYHGPVLRESFKSLQYVLVFAVAAVSWAMDPDRRRVRLAVTLTVAAVAILALAQEFTGSNSGVWIQAWPFPKAYPRIAGPLEGPNQLSGYLGIALPFLAVWSLERASCLVLTASALAVAALVLSLGRAGLLCGIVAVAIVFAIRRRAARAPIVVVFGASLLAAAIVIASWHNVNLAERFFSLGDPLGYGAVGTRRVLWQAAITLWLQHPLLGVGAGNYELLLPTVGVHGVRTHANEWYLQALVEGGIPLLLATFALVWASIAPFVRALRDDLCLAAFAASIGFALHGLVDYLMFYPKVGIMWFALLGLAAAAARAAEPNPRPA
jgi:O-antigen ligase